MLDDMLPDDAAATRGFVAYHVERAHAKLTMQAVKVLGAHAGLTPRQWWIIADMMAEAPETASDLAALSDVDKGQLSRNLKTLVDLGLVATERSAEDRRRQFIRLTAEGRRLHDHTIPLMNARNAHLVRDISSEDLEIGLRMLRRLETAAAETRFFV